MKRTPFHDRLAPMNRPEIFEHWMGYLATTRYEYSELVEYYAVRNAVAVFDSSPLFKYRISGDGAQALAQRIFVRDVAACPPGHGQYNAWCDRAGHVVEDGVILRVHESEYLVTTARPNLRYFTGIASELGLGTGRGAGEVTIDDVTGDFGILAVQGPHSLSVLGHLSGDIAELAYFGLCQTQIAGTAVVVSRTGFTGDLGYEVWVPSASAEPVFDAIWAAGQDYNIAPLGLAALSLARIEAGLLLIDIDFHSARHAWTDQMRDTPIELGWGWMLRGLAQDDRNFIGREAIEAEIANETSRHRTVGYVVDWTGFDAAHRAAGVRTPKEGLLIEDTLSTYRIDGSYLGYATSMIWSPIRQLHLGMAKLPIAEAQIGSEFDLEISIIRRPAKVRARVAPMPFFTPARKTEPMVSIAGPAQRQRPATPGSPA